MSNVLYTSIGFFVVWCAKYVFIPLGVAVLVKIIVDNLLKPHPERKRKRRVKKNRLK